MIQLRDFDPANYLSDEEATAHYLADAAADPDPMPSSRPWAM